MARSTIPDARTLIITALLRPLVRFCLRRGVPSRKCEEVLRKVFVEEAEREIIESGNEVSASKVSLATGLHRGEVSRLLSGEERTRTDDHILFRLIGLWTTKKSYRSRDGSPRPLTFRGLNSEFADLVAEVSREVAPYPVLFELERLGAVRYENDRIVLLVREYVPLGDVEQSFRIVSEDIQDLLQAAERNVGIDRENPQLHLRTVYDNISREKLDELRRWMIERGEAMHREAREAMSRCDADLNPELSGSDAGCRAVFSTFGLTEVPGVPVRIQPKKRGRRRKGESQSEK